MKRQEAEKTNRERTPRDSNAIMRGEVMEMAAAERDMSKDSEGRKYVDERDEMIEEAANRGLRRTLKEYKEKQRREQQEMGEREDLKDEVEE